MGVFIKSCSLSPKPIRVRITIPDERLDVLHLLTSQRLDAVVKADTAEYHSVLRSCAIQVELAGLDNCDDIVYTDSCTRFVFVG